MATIDPNMLAGLYAKKLVGDPSQTEAIETARQALTSVLAGDYGINLQSVSEGTLDRVAGVIGAFKPEHRGEAVEALRTQIGSCLKNPSDTNFSTLNTASCYRPNKHFQSEIRSLVTVATEPVNDGKTGIMQKLAAHKHQFIGGAEVGIGAIGAFDGIRRFRNASQENEARRASGGDIERGGQIRGVVQTVTSIALACDGARRMIKGQGFVNF